MTIHNLKFQGTWNIDDMMRVTGLPGYLFTSDKLEAYGAGNYLNRVGIKIAPDKLLIEAIKEEVDG